MLSPDKKLFLPPRFDYTARALLVYRPVHDSHMNRGLLIPNG